MSKYNFLSEEQISRLQNAIEKVKQAEKEKDELIKEFFSPENTVVHWRKPRAYLQDGKVIHVGYGDLKVLNMRTGKSLWITMHDIDWTAMIGSASWKEEGLPSYMLDDQATEPEDTNSQNAN